MASMAYCNVWSRSESNKWTVTVERRFQIAKANFKNQLMMPAASRSACHLRRVPANGMQEEKEPLKISKSVGTINLGWPRLFKLSKKSTCFCLQSIPAHKQLPLCTGQALLNCCAKLHFSAEPFLAQVQGLQVQSVRRCKNGMSCHTWGLEEDPQLASGFPQHAFVFTVSSMGGGC